MENWAELRFLTTIYDMYFSSISYNFINNPLKFKNF